MCNYGMTEPEIQAVSAPSGITDTRLLETTGWCTARSTNTVFRDQAGTPSLLLII